MIGMKCPNCGKTHANTLDHLKANWTEAFVCDPGCGALSTVDPAEANAILELTPEGETAIIPMHAAPDEIK